MNLALLVKLITQLAAFAETKPGSKGRTKNLSMAALLGICSTILFYSAKIPGEITALRADVHKFDTRLAVIEHELRIAGASTNAAPDVDQLATTSSPGADARTRFTFTRKGDL